MEDAVLTQRLHPISMVQPVISHLLYADDVMIFVTASVPNAVVMVQIFQQLQHTVSLKLNQVKPKIYFSRFATQKGQILQILGMEEDFLPIKYLGVPLSTDYVHANDCASLLNKVCKQIERWDSGLLSTAGRAELIQSTIVPTVLYWLLIFQILNSVLQKNEKMCADFFWSSKYHKIAWELLCRPKADGGIGL